MGAFNQSSSTTTKGIENALTRFDIENVENRLDHLWIEFSLVFMKAMH